MDSPHLAKGSAFPPKENNGKLRLYSMRVCPYVQRVHIVLKAKKIPYEVINVHLQQKPEWLFDLHPEGKVPILDVGDKILIESLDICNYLEQTYPDPPLYPSDPQEKSRDQLLIKKFNDLLGFYYKFYYKVPTNIDNKSLAEYVKQATPFLDEFYRELSKRGPFFGGEKPGMVDFIIWPWAERVGVLRLIYGDAPKIADEYLEKFKSWKERMLNIEAVSQTIKPLDSHIKLVERYRTGAPADYDNI